MQKFLNEDGMANMRDTERIVKEIEELSKVKIDVVHVHGKLYDHDLNSGYYIDNKESHIITDGVIKIIYDNNNDSGTMFDLYDATYLVYEENSKIHVCFALGGIHIVMINIIQALKNLKYIIDGECDGKSQ